MADIKFQDIDLEKIIIKLLLTNQLVKDRAFPFLKVELFENVGYRKIVEKILNFYEEFSKIPSTSDIRLQLSVDGISQEIKDCYLEILEIPVSEYDEEFLFETVEDFFKKRLIADKNANIAMALYDNKLNEIPKFVDDLNNALGFNFNQTVAFDIFEKDSGEEVLDFVKNTANVVSTGIASLDKYMNGGFGEEKLTVFTAESNLGKSLMIGSIAASCLLDNKNVLIVTMEQSSKVYARRIISNLFDIEIGSLYGDSLREENLEKYKRFKNNLKRRLYISDMLPGTTHNNILNLLTSLKLKKKFVPDIIFVDYIKLMNSSRLQKGANTNIQYQYVCEDLRSIGQIMKIPIVSAMQVNRAAYGSSKIDKKDTGDSIGIVQTADVVIGLSQPEDFKANKDEGIGKWLANFAKNRDNISDVTVKLIVYYKKMRVVDDPSNFENEENQPTVSEIINSELDAQDSITKETTEEIFKTAGEQTSKW